MSRRHSVLGASKAAIFSKCPAGPRLWDGLKDEPSEAAILGTICHWLAERCLLDGCVDAADYVGQAISEIVPGPGPLYAGQTIEAIHAETIQPYVDEVWRIVEPDDSFYIERQVSIAPLVPEVPSKWEPFGIADAIVIKESGVLHVVDLKTGAATYVDEAENYQLRHYGYGAYLFARRAYPELKLNKIVLTIVQPGHYSGAEPVRSEILHPLDLVEWAKEIYRPAILATLAPDAPAVPGDHCRFCPAKTRTCPAFERAALAPALRPTFDLASIQPLDDLTEDEAAKRLEQIAILKTWISVLEDRIETAAKEGRIPTGWKWVAGRGRRTWAQSEIATMDLVKQRTGVDISEVHCLSPAQAEKAVGKSKFSKACADLVEMTPGAPKLAKESDPRPAIDPKSETLLAFKGKAPPEWNPHD